MNDSKDSRFRSYIDETELEAITLEDTPKTKLKEGETMVCEAQKVLMFTPLTDRKKSTFGILTLTTFKLSFASAEIESTSDECFQQNLLLAPFEVCLSSIDSIYQFSDRSKKKLPPGHNVSGKVKEIFIVCKNMRVLEFSFKHTEKDVSKSFINALIYHAYPKRHSLLFAYDNREPYYSRNILKEARFFRKLEDWKKELERTRCQNWRISLANCNYQLSATLCSTLIVPQSVTDAALTTAVGHFRNACCPVWVWGSSKGAALVRMADLLPTITDRTQENIMLEHIRKSHPKTRQPHIIDLTKDCPSPKEVQSSYLKLRELCAPDSTRTFKAQDFKLYGLLDSAKWLYYVATCLTKAAEAAEQLCDTSATTVVLQEGYGQDMNCVISSLTQILLDPYWRTKFGFQSLIQKDWIAMGHPFAYRLGHILNGEIEPSPLFLLFLDCVWQLLQQFPTAFQFSETYLTTLWDSAHNSVFETFLFNCDHDRFMAENGANPIILRSVWDWSEQFSDKDIALFCNPLYDDSCVQRLKPNTNTCALEIWVQCYFRWLPDIEIRNGGRPQVDLCSRFIVSEIFQLQQVLTGTEVNGRIARTKEENLELLKKVNSFFPFSYNNKQIPGSLTVDSILLSGDVLETQSILNLND